MKALISLILLTAVTAHGGQKRPSPRKVASVERQRGENSISGAARRVPSDFDFKLGVTSGFSQSNSNVNSTQSARQQGAYHQTASVGIQATLTAWRYGYVDIDTFYAGSPSAKSVTTVDTIVGTQSTSNRRLKAFGGAGEIGGRLPLYLGGIKITPTAGVGFGYFSIRETRESGDATIQSNNAVSGPYGSVGLGVSLGRRVSLSGDAALSFASKGKMDASDTQSIISETESNNARFNRIRAGAYYRLSQPITLGVQYIRRQIRNAVSAESTPVTETTNQVLGAMVVHF
jgi:hypothetical protein